MVQQRIAGLVPRLSLLWRFALVSLIVFGVLGAGIAYFLGQTIQQNALAGARTTAYDTLHARLTGHIDRSDLTDHMTPRERARFQQFLNRDILDGNTVRVKLWNRRGGVVYSTDQTIIGKRFPIKDELQEALAGSVASEVSNLSASENRDDRSLDRQLLEVYIPIRFPHDTQVAGVFEIYQRYAPVKRQIEHTQMRVYELLSGGLGLLYFLLFGIVRSGSNTIIAQQRTLRRYTRDLEASYKQTIMSLAAAVDARDSSTEQHAERVTELALALGCRIGMREDEIRELERGALLHDVGKIGVRDAVLLKPGKLTDDEWREMRRHPEIGHRMLREVSFLQNALDVVRHHHERWDGSGYPDRLQGEDIPLAARLFAVVDAYDAITADRPYRSGSPHHVAMARLREDSGTQFDPRMVCAFEDMMRERAGEVAPSRHLAAS